MCGIYNTYAKPSGISLDNTIARAALMDQTLLPCSLKHFPMQNNAGNQKSSQFKVFFSSEASIFPSKLTGKKSQTLCIPPTPMGLSFP